MDLTDIEPALVIDILKLIDKYGPVGLRDGLDAVLAEYWLMNPSQGKHAYESVRDRSRRNNGMVHPGR